MIRDQWLRHCVSVACAAVVLLFASAISTNKLLAQAAQPGGGGPAAAAMPRPAVPAGFLVPQEIALGYSPTSLAAGHLTSSGMLDLVTADSSTGTVRVYVAAGPDKFAPPLVYSAGTHVSAIAIADIDGDGKADVIVASDSDRAINVFPGNGDGTLGDRKTYTVGFAPSMLALGDFSGGGQVDIAVAGNTGTTLTILQNDGTGKLLHNSNVVLSTIPASIAAADFNQDGHLDLALANLNGTVSVLLGKANGQFTALPDISVTKGALSSIAAADFNRNGHLDLAVTSTAGNQVAVLQGQGDGKFSPPVIYGVGNAPVSVQVADPDEDGIPDLIVINRDSNTFTVLDGAGDGTFNNPQHYVVGNSPVGGVLGDFHGTGSLSLATVNQLSGTLTLPAYTSQGTFATGRVYIAGKEPVAVATGDLNGDGHADLVTGSYCEADATCGGSGSVAVLLADNAVGYRITSSYPMGAGTVSLALVDVNGDKNLDLVALNRADRTLSVRLGHGDGTFGDLVTTSLSGSPLALASGDFNGDQNTDLALLVDCGASTCSQPGEVDILLGAGDGTFHNGTAYSTGYSPVGIAAGATRTGGPLDVIVANRCGQAPACQAGGTASVFYGTGTGAFARGADISLGSSPSALALADISGSGLLDLLVSHATDNTLAVHAGKGDGSFKPAVSYPVGSQPGSLAIADFNGDGIADVAVANAGDSSVSVLYGSYGSGLQPAGHMPVGGNPTAIAAVPGASGHPASLATTNGIASASATGAALTLLANGQPMAGGGTAPTVALTPNPLTFTVNQTAPITLSVSVTGIPGTTPSGTVDIASDGTPKTICSALTLSAGATSCTAPANLQADITSLTATYTPDSNSSSTYTTATGTANVTATQLSPTLNLNASPATSSPVNTVVTFTATLSGVNFSPINPGGTITFKLGSANATCVGASNPITVDPKTQSAACQIQDMQFGSNSVSAVYSGDTNFTTATGSTSYSTTAAQPTFTISASPSGTVQVGTSVTYTATVAGVSFSPTPPSGNIAFTFNGQSVASCSGKISNSQTAQCTVDSIVVPENTVSAEYSGDTNFAPTTNPATLSQAGSQFTPTVNLKSSQNPSVVNQTVTLTAVVPAPAGQTGQPYPTGGVTFTQGNTTLCGAQLLSKPTLPLSSTNQPTATCSAAFSSVSSGSTPAIVATYGGDTNFASATSSNLAQGVSADGTTTNLASSGATAINQPVTFTATVVPANSGAAIPQGTVTFAVAGASPTGTCSAGVTLTAGVAPSCTFTFASAGTFNVTATFNPTDGNFLTSTSKAVAQGINPGSVTVNLTSGLNPSTVNHQVTFTAAFSAINGTQPNGTMTFTDTSKSQTLCQATVTSGSSSTCTVPFGSAGAHTVTATFASSDKNFNGATSNVVTQSVSQTSTSTAVVSAIPSSSANQAVTFTATVTPGVSGATAPTGNVTFNSSLNGQTTILCSSARPVSTSGGVTTASCSAPFPITGSYSITADFSGDGNFLSSASPAIPQTVVAGTTTVSIAGPSSSPSVNQTATFTATIAPGTTGSSSPTGKVTFADSVSGTQICSPVTVTANGSGGASASCTVSFLAAGTHTLSATYSGDSNFGGNTSSSAVKVLQTATTLSLAPSINPAVATVPVTFVAVVSPSVKGGAVPSGTVAFTSADGTLNSCKAVAVSPSSGTASASCTAMFPHTTNFSTGQIGVTAVYSGDSNFTANPSGQAISETVQDFNVAFTVTPTMTSGSTNNSSAQEVFVTQGYSNNTDLFNPATINAVVTSSGGYNHALNATCAVINTASNSAVADPSCSLSTASPSGATGTSVMFTVNASANAPIGTYAVTVTAVDKSVPGLSQTTAPLTVNVLGTSASLNVATGATGSLTAQFNTGTAVNGTTLTTFSCPLIWDTTNMQFDSNVNNSLISCTGPSGTVATTGADTPVQITIKASKSTQAQLERGNSLQLAGVIGLPLLALFGWFGSKGNRRKNLLRLFSTIVLALGISCAIGCGGSFTRPGTLPSNGIAPGNYLVQVIATDASGNQYYAVVPLVVSSVNGQ